jgi:hypothetical protein
LQIGLSDEKKKIKKKFVIEENFHENFIAIDLNFDKLLSKQQYLD